MEGILIVKNAKPTAHLTSEEHMEAARLLNQAEQNLRQVAHIVNRALFSDQTLRVSQTIQEILIDPLREGWDGDPDRAFHDNPYQSVGYVVSGTKHFIKRMKEPI